MAASPKLLQAGSVVVTLRAPGSVSQEVGVGQASGRGLFLPLSPLCSSCAPPQAQVLAPTAHIPSSQLKCLERRSAPAQPVIGHRCLRFSHASGQTLRNQPHHSAAFTSAGLSGFYLVEAKALRGVQGCQGAPQIVPLLWLPSSSEAKLQRPPCPRWVRP